MQEDYNPDLISLSDEEGNEYNFEILDAVETDEGKYVALIPSKDEDNNSEEQDNLIIMKVYEEENGDNYFEEIASDDEYETIADTFINRLSDSFDIIEEG